MDSRLDVLESQFDDLVVNIRKLDTQLSDLRERLSTQYDSLNQGQHAMQLAALQASKDQDIALAKIGGQLETAILGRDVAIAKVEAMATDLTAKVDQHVVRLEMTQAQMQGGITLFKWVVPVLIAAAGLIISGIVYITNSS